MKDLLNMTNRILEGAQKQGFHRWSRAEGGNSKEYYLARTALEIAILKCESKRK